MDFPRSFPLSRLITLEENYRSTQPILNLANTLISFSNERYSKCLFSRSPKGVPPVCVELPYEESQSQFVVQQLQTLNREGMAWQEMAVLFRAGHHSFNLEIALQKQGIPFVKVGGRRLVEGSHIKDFLSYLKVVVNPQDVLAWERILRLLEGLGPKRAQDLIGQVQIGTDWSGRLSSLQHYPRLRPQMEPLESLLKELTAQALQPTQALELIWEYYRELLPRIYEEDYQRRQKEIEEIIRVSLNYSDLEAFLGDLALEAYEGEKTREGGRLTLSTVHSAKGLEWKAVFIIWLTEGRFPSIHALETAEETEEERRLLYVAVTRARERLFLTYPRALSPRAGGWQQQEICRFLTAIPKDILPRLGEPVAPPPPRKEVYPSSAPDNGFPVGMRVFHPLFGTGVIQEAPRERKVRVLFKRYGSKVLHLDYAQLEKGEVPDARSAL
jgi:DNA helicase-2/ATP-dependent DNA helicase PcrA